MREVAYHRHAARYMRRMPADRKEQLKTALDQLAGLDELLAIPTSSR